MIVKDCVIFERTLLSRKESHNLAWSCAISNDFYCAISCFNAQNDRLVLGPKSSSIWRFSWNVETDVLLFEQITHRESDRSDANKRSRRQFLLFKRHLFNLQRISLFFEKKPPSSSLKEGRILSYLSLSVESLQFELGLAANAYLSYADVSEGLSFHASKDSKWRLKCHLFPDLPLHTLRFLALCLHLNALRFKGFLFL